MNLLVEIANKLVAKSKGILAADESTGTMTKRLDSIGVESTEENRRIYRSLLLEAEGMEKYISGVILYDETIRQGLGRILLDKGILVGIKVDQGLNEVMITEGLAGLKERLIEYIKLGAVFTKWRAVITIGGKDNLEENAIRLAEYAKVAQEAGMVPIVEPEVLMDGDHSLERCEEVTGRTLEKVFSELKKYKVMLEGILLKPNMVLSGKDCLTPASVKEIAEATVRCFKKHVPVEVPGCVFLSGGLSPDEATERLNAINQSGELPWEMSFSFGRALQQEALQAWEGKAENKEKMQEAFLKRAEKLSQARNGKF
ncbi:MAG: class I fructose-bisphosphate aldolase [Patescibacteria group bacterium]|nr:class I fructose-bisphosphate aldolase [Patescibacteria group bacterium]